jgi:hypothetical protein
MAALDYRDKIRAMAEQKPVQPTAVAKELMTNSMLSSAMLSEMTEKGLLKVSSLKVGSSPIYYHPDHPEHLLDYVQNLNEKDRRTVVLLKEQGVLSDTSQDPLTRVSLRNVKDFAKPLDVTVDGNKSMFWKFYTLTDEEAAEKIKQMLQPAEQPKAPKARKPRARKPKVAIEPQTQLQAAQAPVATQKAPVAAQVVAPVAAKASVASAPVVSASVREEPALKPAAIEAPSDEQKPIAPAEAASQALTGDDPFLQKLMAFFASNNITILEQIALKKKSEYDFVLQLASPVGQLHYYCKAKNKAKVGEADLSHAFVQGQLKKLPVLFLAPGILTKPAQDLMKELKGLTVKQV